MSLQKWLLPGENITYTAPDNVSFAGVAHRLHISNERIILYDRKGLIFKKEFITAERLEDIATMQYREEGLLFNKKGSLAISTKHKIMEFKGKPEAIHAIWQALQQYIRR